jgi:hypothetical protein
MTKSAGDLFRRLGTPEELTALVAGGYGVNRLKVNAHIHLPPNFSAFRTVGEAVDLAATQGIGVLGASNYYHYGIYSEFAALSRERNILPLFGLEIVSWLEDLARRGIRINDPVNPGKMYLCGKSITRFESMEPLAAQIITLIRRTDSDRMAAMIKLLENIFAAHGAVTNLDTFTVKQMVVKRHDCASSWVYLQERHVAQAFQEVLFDRLKSDERVRCLAGIFGGFSQDPDSAVGVQSEIRSQLMKAGKPGYVEERFVTFEEARRLTLALGGIPCYPVLADGANPITEFEREPGQLVENLRARNVHCAEFIPLRNRPEVLSRYVKAMRGAGMIVTAGTEHNTLEVLPMEPTGAGGAPIREDLQEIFWEGACVLAAHQFLGFHGREGFVDGEGNLNRLYGTQETRIEAFRALGAAVIGKFRESNTQSKSLSE